jgi:hypothetical protein
MPRSAFEIIHGDNYAALMVAILHRRYLTPEQAFSLYDFGVVKRSHTPKEYEIRDMLAEGASWSEITIQLGFKNKTSAQSYYSHRKRKMKG